MRTVMREDWDGRGRRGMEERERGGGYASSFTRNHVQENVLVRERYFKRKECDKL